MILIFMVDGIDQGRQGGGLAGTGLAGDQHDALVKVWQLQNRRGKPEGVKSRDVLTKQTERHRGYSLLFEDVKEAIVIVKMWDAGDFSYGTDSGTGN